MFVRQAILLQWITIFVPKGTRNLFFWTCHVVFWVNTVFYITTGVLIIVDQRSGGEGLSLASACVNMIIDIIILFLPQKVIWSLHMSNARKVGISAVFSLGVL